MKMKIILIILVCLFNISIVNCEILDEGSFNEISYKSESISLTHTAGGQSDMDIEYLWLYQSQNYQSGLQYIYIDIPGVHFKSSIKSTYDSYNENIELIDGVDVVAEGKIGYYKKESGEYRIWLWFDLTSWEYTGTGTKYFPLTGHTNSYYGIYNSFLTQNALDTPTNTNAAGYMADVGVTDYWLIGGYTIDIVYNFKNIYYTTLNEGMYNIIYNRTTPGYSTISKVKITDSIGTILLNESSYKENDLSLSYFNSNTPYKLECENYIETDFLDYLNFKSTYDPFALRIEVDDIEVGNNIKVSYFNIDELRSNPLKYGSSDYATCDINLQIIVDRGYYEELIYQDLITDESDNIFYYSSDSLTNGIYYTQINKVLGGLNDYAVRSTFTISQPSNYSIIVNPDNVYVGDNINIIYKSLNQSTISIYDNSSTLIKSYLNIQNEGQKIFQIPPDNDYNNVYSNWFVYLNDTGNSSNNLRYNFTVNWKVYTEPIPTPIPTEPYFNESIEESIDELKEGINPIKEFIFGISTIFVDNPDYNNDNVVDVNEISTWLNSLISIAIIIFLFILYTVYKRG